MQGKTRWFNNVKGYGFIIPDDGGPDLFFHHSELRAKGAARARLAEQDGTPVEFEPAEGEKGRFAKNVRLVRALPSEAAA